VGYYVRAFCASVDLPPLARAFEWAAAQGVSLELEDEPGPGSLDSARWRTAEIRYKHGKPPLAVDVSRAADHGLPFEEVEEFIEFLEGYYDGERLIVELALRKSHRSSAASCVRACQRLGVDCRFRAMRRDPQHPESTSTVLSWAAPPPAHKPAHHTGPPTEVTDD
jgi:hypothetical protein